MDCYKCKYRGSVPGSVHSSCTFIREANKGDDQSKVMQLELLLASHQVKMTAKTEEGKEIELVEINEQGIRGGWASWPLDFDPIWITKCHFYGEEPV
jgi:hypothetical protein